MKTNRVRFNPPFEKGAQNCRKKALSRKNYDPASLFRWGQLMAVSVLEMLKAVEEKFGAEGQRVATETLRKVGLMAGREMVAGVEIPEGASPIEVISSFATCINVEAYASPEAPDIKDRSHCGFDIIWCPHEDYYKAFDCRVQRYIVQGMIDAFKEKFAQQGIDFNVRFVSTIPSGSKTCRFEIREKSAGEEDDWSSYSSLLAQKALKHTVIK